MQIDQSIRFQCSYADDRFDYAVQGGASPGVVEATIDARIDGDGWSGTAVVDLGDHRYVGVVSGPTGSIDASADGVEWSGVGTHTSDADPSIDEEVPMSISIPCR